MANLGTLTLDLLCKIGSFTGPLDKAERHSKKTADGISRHQREITGAIGSSLKSLAGWAAGFVAFGAMKSFVENSLKAAGAIQDVAATAGITTDTLQEMRHVTSMFGVSAEQADQGLQKFNKSIGELKAGTGSLYTYLSKTDKALLSQVQSAGSADAALDIIFKSMKNVADSSERSALAVAAFGKSGQRMAVMADDYENLRKEARDLGLVIDSDLIKSADEAGDKFDTMAMVIKTQLTSAVLELAPVIQKTAEQIIKLSRATAKFFNVKTVDEIDVEIAALEELRSEYKQTEDTLTAMKAQKGYLLPGELDQLSQAKNNVETLTESIKELNGTKMGAGTSDGGGDAALSQQQSVEIYKKAFSELEQITQKTYDVMKGVYQDDYDEFFELTGDKLTAQAIYNKNMKALNEKLTGKDSGDSWEDFGKVLKNTSEANKQRLEIIKSSNLAIKAENDRQLQDDIARDAELRQLIDDANLAELNNISDNIEKEIALHEYKFAKLKELYSTGSDELGAIERLQAAERINIDANSLDEENKIRGQRLSDTAAIFDKMAGLAEQYGDRQSDIYKNMFTISKLFALAQAAVDMGVAMSKSGASAAWPYNLIPIAGAAVEMGAIIASIAAVNFSGAKDSGGSIPSGKWGIVGERGPEIVNGPASVTSRIDTAGILGSKQSVKIINVIDPKLISDWAQTDEGERIIVNTISRNRGEIASYVLG